MAPSRTLNTDGCEFGRMVRKDLDFIVKKIDTGFNDIKVKLNKSEKNQTELFNHQSSRIPKDVSNRMNRLYALLGTIVGGVLVGLIVFLLTRV